MILSVVMARRIVTTSLNYVGTPYSWEEFNCVHFIRKVYGDVGIVFPRLVKEMDPPVDFHLSEKEFEGMPLGQSVFFKRKESQLARSWTHIAIIISPTELVHCARRLERVVVTPREEFLETYALSPTAKPLF
jgi:cell wall-associated NlpC family hydrolase